MGRLGKKIANGLRMGAKIGGVGLAVAGTYLLGSKAKEGADYAQLQAGNAKTLQQQGVSSAQAVIASGPLGAQREANFQAQQLGQLANLAGSGQNISEMVSSQAQQQKLVQEAMVRSRSDAQFNNAGGGGLKRMFGFG